MELIDTIRTVAANLVELGQLNLVEFIFLTLAIPITMEAYRTFLNRNVRKIALHDIRMEMRNQIDFTPKPQGINSLSDFEGLIEDRILRLENGTANLSALYGRILKNEDLVQIGQSFMETKAFLKRIDRYASERQFALLPTPETDWPSTDSLKIFRSFVGEQEVDRIWNFGGPNIKALADETAKRKFEDNQRWLEERAKNTEG